MMVAAALLASACGKKSDSGASSGEDLGKRVVAAISASDVETLSKLLTDSREADLQDCETPPKNDGMEKARKTAFQIIEERHGHKLTVDGVVEMPGKGTQPIKKGTKANGCTVKYDLIFHSVHVNVHDDGGAPLVVALDVLEADGRWTVSDVIVHKPTGE